MIVLLGLVTFLFFARLSRTPFPVQIKVSLYTTALFFFSRETGLCLNIFILLSVESLAAVDMQEDVSLRKMLYLAYVARIFRALLVS